MKYKFLKQIACEKSVHYVGDVVIDVPESKMILPDGLKVSIPELINQGFIEEVKETPSKNWRIGDKVVIELAGWDKRYGKIDGIMGDNYIACGGENWMVEKFREPTHEENARYFN